MINQIQPIRLDYTPVYNALNGISGAIQKYGEQKHADKVRMQRYFLDQININPAGFVSEENQKWQSKRLEQVMSQLAEIERRAAIDKGYSDQSILEANKIMNQFSQEQAGLLAKQKLYLDAQQVISRDTKGVYDRDKFMEAEKYYMKTTNVPEQGFLYTTPKNPVEYFSNLILQDKPVKSPQNIINGKRVTTDRYVTNDQRVAAVDSAMLSDQRLRDGIINEFKNLDDTAKDYWFKQADEINDRDGNTSPEEKANAYRLFARDKYSNLIQPDTYEEYVLQEKEKAKKPTEEEKMKRFDFKPEESYTSTTNERNDKKWWLGSSNEKYNTQIPKTSVGAFNVQKTDNFFSTIPKEAYYIVTEDNNFVKSINEAETLKPNTPYQVLSANVIDYSIYTGKEKEIKYNDEKGKRKKKVIKPGVPLTEDEIKEVDKKDIDRSLGYEIIGATGAGEKKLDQFSMIVPATSETTKEFEKYISDDVSIVLKLNGSQRDMVYKVKQRYPELSLSEIITELKNAERL